MSDSNVTTAFATLESDPYGEWEEDPGLNLSLDIENISKYFQELARKLLQKDEKEFENFLEKILQDNMSYKENNILELIDITCNAQRKSEEFSNKAVNFIANPKNSKSAKIYKRYQN